jgi:4-hydroxybenzoyl-CoA thioesterase
MTKTSLSKSRPSSSRSSSTPTRPFRAEVLVRFGDCDPAGIVFYPRYLEFFNNIVEDWCRQGLQFSFPDLVAKRGLGLPTVHLDVDFTAPSRFGELLSATLAVRSVGTSSVDVEITLHGPDGSLRVRGGVVLVLIDRKPHKAIPIPDDLRARMLAFRASA